MTPTPEEVLARWYSARKNWTRKTAWSDCGAELYDALAASQEQVRELKDYWEDMPRDDAGYIALAEECDDVAHGMGYNDLLDRAGHAIRKLLTRRASETPA